MAGGAVGVAPQVGPAAWRGAPGFGCRSAPRRAASAHPSGAWSGAGGGSRSPRNREWPNGGARGGTHARTRPPALLPRYFA